MSSETKKPKKSQFMQIAQQVAETQRAQKQRDQEQADASKSPPAILGSADSSMRALFCTPQMG